MTQTLALIKPDCVEKRLYPLILDQILRKGFKIVKMEMLQMSPQLAEEFYAVHQGKNFFPKLIEDITSGQLIALVLEKNETDVIDEWRKAIGNTNPDKANPGTLRRMFGCSIGQNGLHGSDSPKNAQREIALLFF